MATILVVDDDPLVCELVGEMLLSDGHQVVRAADGAQALDAIGRGEIDLVLTDVFMPGEDGIGLMRSLRAQDSQLPMIVFTGKNDARFDALDVAKKLGADAVLRKPLQRDMVLAAVHTVLGQDRA